MKRVLSWGKSLMLLFVVSTVLFSASSFKPVEINSDNNKSCVIGFHWSITNPIATAAFAFGSVEDSFSDITNGPPNFTSWSSSFNYAGGSLIFTVQFPGRHPGGTLTLYEGSNPIATASVVANDPTIHLLVDTSVSCTVDYSLVFS